MTVTLTRTRDARIAAAHNFAEAWNAPGDQPVATFHPAANRWVTPCVWVDVDARHALLVDFHDAHAGPRAVVQLTGPGGFTLNMPTAGVTPDTVRAVIAAVVTW